MYPGLKALTDAGMPREPFDVKMTFFINEESSDTQLHLGPQCFRMPVGARRIPTEVELNLLEMEDDFRVCVACDPEWGKDTDSSLCQIVAHFDELLSPLNRVMHKDFNVEEVALVLNVLDVTDLPFLKKRWVTEWISATRSGVMSRVPVLREQLKASERDIIHAKLRSYNLPSSVISKMENLVELDDEESRCLPPSYDGFETNIVSAWHANGGIKFADPQAVISAALEIIVLEFGAPEIEMLPREPLTHYSEGTNFAEWVTLNWEMHATAICEKKFEMLAEFCETKADELVKEPRAYLCVIEDETDADIDWAALNRQLSFFDGLIGGLISEGVREIYEPEIAIPVDGDIDVLKALETAKLLMTQGTHKTLSEALTSAVALEEEG